MDAITLEKMAVTAFANLTSSRSALFTATEAAIMEKYLLEEQRAAATTGGVFDGKNAEIREAQAREHLQAQYLKLAHAENFERKTLFDYDLASVEVDTVKTLLRIAELT